MRNTLNTERMEWNQVYHINLQVDKVANHYNVLPRHFGLVDTWKGVLDDIVSCNKTIKRKKYIQMISEIARNQNTQTLKS